MSSPFAAAAAGVAAAVDAVTMTISEVRDIANTTFPGMETEATSSTQSFRDLAVSQGAYGEVPLAQAFGAQHDAAQQVFRDTITAVLEDLNTFRDNLLACAQGHESNEDAVAATFAAMNNRYGADYRFHTDTAYRRSRADDRLDVPADETQSSGEPQGGTAPTQPAPTEPSSGQSSFGQ